MTLDAPQRWTSPHRGTVHRPVPRAGPVVALTWVVVALTTGAALLGLVLDGVYAGATATAATLRGFDLVTLVLVVPALATAGHLARRGSPAAPLAVATLAAYLVYTYAYYLFGTGFNDLFLLHVAVFATALPLLGLSLASLDVTAVHGPPASRRSSGLVAAILAVLGVALGGMWVVVALRNAVTGNVPSGSQLVETDLMVHLGMALDLTVLVPLYAVAAALLWRQATWGYPIATIALVAGVLHQVSYLVAMPFQVAADVPGAVATDPAEPVIVLLYVAAAAVLLRRSDQAGT